MIIALAGRRVDAPSAPTPRFPFEQVDAVRDRLRQAFAQRQAQVLVSSAACGADLLALEVAGELGMRRRIILPFPREAFRAASVTDRPGDWGALYDRVLDEVEAAGDVVVLDMSGEPDAAYGVASERIITEALQLAEEPDHQGQRDRVIAIVVWDKVSRGEGDLTLAFAKDAVAHKIPVIDIATL